MAELFRRHYPHSVATARRIAQEEYLDAVHAAYLSAFLPVTNRCLTIRMLMYEAGCAVGTRMQIADKMSVDLSDVDRRAHEPTGDRGLLRCLERDIWLQFDVSSLEAIGVIAGSG